MVLRTTSCSLRPHPHHQVRRHHTALISNHGSAALCQPKLIHSYTLICASPRLCLSVCLSVCLCFYLYVQVSVSLSVCVFSPRCRLLDHIFLCLGDCLSRCPVGPIHDVLLPSPCLALGRARCCLSITSIDSLARGACHWSPSSTLNRPGFLPASPCSSSSRPSLLPHSHLLLAPSCVCARPLAHRMSALEDFTA